MVAFHLKDLSKFLSLSLCLFCLPFSCAISVFFFSRLWSSLSLLSESLPSCLLKHMIIPWNVRSLYWIYFLSFRDTKWVCPLPTPPSFIVLLPAVVCQLAWYWYNCELRGSDSWIEREAEMFISREWVKCLFVAVYFFVCASSGSAHVGCTKLFLWQQAMLHVLQVEQWLLTLSLPPSGDAGCECRCHCCEVELWWIQDYPPVQYPAPKDWRRGKKCVYVVLSRFVSLVLLSLRPLLNPLGACCQIHPLQSADVESPLRFKRAFLVTSCIFQSLQSSLLQLQCTLEHRGGQWGPAPHFPL